MRKRALEQLVEHLETQNIALADEMRLLIRTGRDGLDLGAIRTTATERARVAEVLRDWIHTTPLSECSIGDDTCPDWPLAFKVADLVLHERADVLEARNGGSPPDA